MDKENDITIVSTDEKSIVFKHDITKLSTTIKNAAADTDTIKTLEIHSNVLEMIKDYCEGCEYTPTPYDWFTKG